MRPTSWIPFWVTLVSNILIVALVVAPQGQTVLRSGHFVGAIDAQGRPVDPPPLSEPEEPLPMPPIPVGPPYRLLVFAAQAVVQLGFTLIMVPNRWLIALAVAILLPTLYYWLISFHTFFFPSMLAVAYAFGKRAKKPL